MELPVDLLIVEVAIAICLHDDDDDDDDDVVKLTYEIILYRYIKYIQYVVGIYSSIV